jgi:peptidylprolyl isomerase
MFKKFIIVILGVMCVTMVKPVKKASANNSKFITVETSQGNVVIETLPKIAPNHVKRIKELVKKGFYDGIIFHRVIAGFMAQTGDPDGNGTGGSGKNLKAEFSDYEYKYGTVGMARSMNPDSGDSQFFICFDGCSHLTGQYTVWGQVVSGMEAVEKLAVGEPPSNQYKMVSFTLVKK